MKSTSNKYYWYEGDQRTRKLQSSNVWYMYVYIVYIYIYNIYKGLDKIGHKHLIISRKAFVLTFDRYNGSPQQLIYPLKREKIVGKII